MEVFELLLSVLRRADPLYAIDTSNSGLSMPDGLAKVDILVSRSVEVYWDVMYCSWSACQCPGT